MAYLGKNINMTLILIIVGVVIVLLGITVFFQLGLQNRTSAYEQSSQNLTACLTQVDNYKERLTQAETKVESASADIKSYDRLYETKVAELSDTQGELSSANAKITNLNLIKTSLEKEKADLQATVTQKDISINQLSSQLTTAENQRDNWENKFECCIDQATISECISICD